MIRLNFTYEEDMCSNSWKWNLWGDLPFLAETGGQSKGFLVYNKILIEGRL